MKNRFITVLFCVVSAMAAIQPLLHADSLSSGSATIDFSQSGWNALASGLGVGQPVLTLGDFLTSSQAAGYSETQLLSLSDGAYSTSYTGQVYSLDGSSISNGSDQYAQPTTFSFPTGDPTGATGSIGLGGISIFDVAAAAGGGRLLYGDYTLAYDPARAAAPYDGSGWYLKGNIPPAAAAFDILGASVSDSNGTLSISGTLGVSYEVANLLYATPTDQGANVGTFSFTGAVVPEPSSFALLIGACVFGFCARRKLR